MFAPTALGGVRRFAEVLDENLRYRRIVERHSPYEHFVEDHAERIEIAPLIRWLALGLFGRHVMRSAEDHPRRCECRARGLERFGDAEIEKLGDLVAVAIARHHDVLRLQIAMDYTFAVREHERAPDPFEQPHRALRLPRALSDDHLLEAAPVDELHDDVESTVGGLSQVVHGHDVRMAQRGRRARFAQKPLDHVGRRNQLGFDELDGNGFVQHQVGATIDRSHSASFEKTVDAILSVECLPDRLLLERDRIGRIGKYRPVVGTHGFVSRETALALRTLAHRTMLTLSAASFQSPATSCYQLAS